jgi:hypothetical protein
VNYFGHAAVAAYLAPAVTGGVVLGAMLPDFATMCGARPAAITDGAISRGVALHHATDAAFHGLASFTGLVRELGARLTTAGVGRGPTRGVAHIGVELLLDASLLDDADARAAYHAGLAHDPAGIAWPDGDAPRFAQLHDRLRGYGLPDDLRRPEAIAHRILRVLAHRPRLAPTGDEPAAIRKVVIGFAARVEVAAATVMHGLAAAMADQAAPGARWARPAG